MLARVEKRTQPQPHRQFCHFHFYRLLCPRTRGAISGSLPPSLLARPREHRRKRARWLQKPASTRNPAGPRGKDTTGTCGLPSPSPRVEPGRTPWERHYRNLRIALAQPQFTLGTTPTSPCPAQPASCPTVAEFLETSTLLPALQTVHSADQGTRQGLWESPTISGPIRSAV